MKKNIIFILLSLTLTSCSQKLNEKLRPHLSDLIGESLTIAIIGDAPIAKEEIKLPPIPDVKRDGKTFGGFKGEEQINIKAIPEGRMEDLNIHFIGEIYEEVKGTQVTKKELNKWINVLRQGGTREGVYRAIVLDGSYYKLERKNIPLTDGTIDFALQFSKTFLGNEISSEAMEKINFFRLKRELTDRGLEVIDALSGNLDDVYNWYAVFSSDLASKYSFAWKLKTRKNPSKEFQKRWAQGVPVQMLKSEVLIKINRLFNQLNK